MNDLHPTEKAAEFDALELGVKVAGAMLIEQHPDRKVRTTVIGWRAARALSIALYRYRDAHMRGGV
jgi:hypothetical protein